MNLGVKVLIYPLYLVTGAIHAFLVLNPKTKLVDQVPRIIILGEVGLKTEYVSINGRNVLIAATDKIFEIIKNIVIK